jgi:phosphoglycerol transferase MdoB-like AlkP superfamily enzyme
MSTYKNLVPAHLRFLLAVHAILLLIYTVFRSITLIYNRPTYLFQVDASLSIRQAFRIGLLFDITVAAYALLIPYILLTLTFLWPKLSSHRLHAIVRTYCVVAILISLIICAADVPYFNFFNSRLNTAAIALKNIGQSARYILQEPQYYPFILIILAFIWGTGRVVNRIWGRNSDQRSYDLPQRIGATALASLVLLCSLWGGAVPKRPDMKSATFSNDGFMNQLTLNPVHTWFDSYFDFNIYNLSLGESIALTQKSLKIDSVAYESPIAREHRFANPPKKPMNVVLILMESMSAARMGIFGNKKNLTPGLDSLAKHSLFYDQCYSNGIHTNAGIYSTLYGLPIMMMQHPMTNGRSEHLDFSGLPVTLRNLGYNTTFFCTHPKTFDNLDVFLQRNGYQYVSDQFDYPQAQWTNSWGVSDEHLFQLAHQKLDSLSNDPSGKPFFGTILTISAHPPFTIPANTVFKPRSSDPIEITFEYADWSLKNFMDRCAKEPWYKNTIFVMVGDHGVNLPSSTDVPLSYNHVPLLIHAPGLLPKPARKHDLASQIDIYPTIMGLLRQNYVQNSFGFDLNAEKRDLVYFSQDHKLGVMDNKYLYVARKSGSESLYVYQDSSFLEVSAQNSKKMDNMRTFACAQLQVAQWMIENKATGKMAK